MEEKNEVEVEYKMEKRSKRIGEEWRGDEWRGDTLIGLVEE